MANKESHKSNDDPNQDDDLDLDELSVDESELTEDDKTALRIASPSELSAEDLVTFRGFRRAAARWMYRPATEFVVFTAILISVGIAIYEVAGASQPFDFDGQQDQSRLRQIPLLFWLDVGLSFLFLAEYLLRIWLAPDRWKFVRTHVVDLVALLPVLRIFRLGRALRLLRILRILRIIQTRTLYIGRVQDFIESLKPNSTEQAIVIVYLGLSIAVGTIGVMFFEGGEGSGFETVWDGIWWSIVTVTTVGYGDKAPVTAGGRVVAGFVMVVGLSFYGVVTGMISKSLIDRARTKNEGNMDVSNMRDHVLVCGWNEDTLPLVRDLKNSRDYDGIVIITSESLSDESLPDDVAWVRGDPTELDVLQRAGLRYAREVIVLAAEREGMTAQDTDSRSVLTAMAAKRHNEDAHILVQLLRETNRDHCESVGVNEVIVASQFDSTILRKAARYPGTAQLYDQFLGAGSQASLHTEVVSEALVGTTFANATASFLRDSRGVPIALIRDGSTMHAPSGDTELQRGDRLVVVRAS